MDGSLCLRVLGNERGNVTLMVCGDAALRGLASGWSLTSGWGSGRSRLSTCHSGGSPDGGHRAPYPIGLGRGPCRAEKSPWCPKKPRCGRFTCGSRIGWLYSRAGSRNPPPHLCLAPSLLTRSGCKASPAALELRRTVVGVVVAP